MFQSILSVGGATELAVLWSLISRGFHVVNVSHLSYAAPIVRSSLFNAVIVCHTVIEKMSKKELTAMVREFKGLPVLAFNEENSPGDNVLVLISPGRNGVDGKRESAQLVSDLQLLLRRKTACSPASLQSWKEISSYLGRGIRTVQRWEKRYGLPIHRPSGGDRSAVFALKSEIDEWMRNRSTILTNSKGSTNYTADTRLISSPTRTTPGRTTLA